MTVRSIFVYFVAFAVVGFVRGQIIAEEEHDHDHHDHHHDHDHQDDAVVTDAATHDAHAGHTHAHSSSGCGVTELQNYNLALHIAAVFVMLVASALGVFLPVILGKLGPRNKLFGSLFSILKYFGSGIIISLAFVHLLIHAFFNLTSACVGDMDYESVAPAIAMATVIVVWLVDFFGSRYIARQNSCLPEGDRNITAASSSYPVSQGEKKIDGISTPMTELACCGPNKSKVTPFDGAAKTAHWNVQLLEYGVIFHSIMIGVSLGAMGTGFNTTFAALVFHQLFEGLGLGARIAMLVWPPGVSSTIKKWAMCLAYALVTPVGIAIGIGVHESINMNGRAILLSTGILDSISAGILLYSGLCQLLYREWVVGDMRDASTGEIIVALVSLFLGLFAMSFIGKWI
ncbi:solute carrier family 39 (zinc transporter), member 1/2/3 [Cryptococcus deuterogattii LA55]|nr:solute carrier family 39 (zinc transporter), member 1/2/3 [Cryptococcus deuterogattii LA55]KIR33388.1 solute carrier family 39 (zinc transporter), member 1/2/3 [Cryptococcus deuterogattii MMRL2647]KIR91641.1 solute carrier family 39 (zinc transporter), member 1/2/3 [Cryptococcus deuterogattii CBS 10090]